jgi:hypothetical protein
VLTEKVQEVVGITRYDDLTLTTSWALVEKNGVLPYSAPWINVGRTDLGEGNYENR